MGVGLTENLPRNGSDSRQHLYKVGASFRVLVCLWAGGMVWDRVLRTVPVNSAARIVSLIKSK